MWRGGSKSCGAREAIQGSVERLAEEFQAQEVTEEDLTGIKEDLAWLQKRMSSL